MKFSEENLFKCVNVKKYFRAPIVASDTNFFANDGKSSIVKLQHQKLLHSWTLEHPHCFTTPITYDVQQDLLYCVVDNNTLLKWSPDDESLTSAFKFKFQEDIFAVIPSKKQQPVILFTSGKVLPAELLYISLNPQGKSFIDEDELIWADSVMIHSEMKIICLTHSAKENTYRLHDISLNKREFSNHSFHLIENENHSLKSWCLDKYNLAFITVWSDGIILKQPLQNQSQSVLLKLDRVNTDNQMAVSFLDADHIVQATSNVNKKETVLEMWDVKFKTVKAKKVLKFSSSECHQIETINQSLFLVSNDCLTEVPFDVEKSTLASALGKSSGISSKSEYRWKGLKFETIVDENSDVNIVKQDMTSNSEVEKMDTDNAQYHIENLARQLIKEGSSFKTNNRESDLFELLLFALRIKLKQKEKDELDSDALLNALFSSTFRDTAFVHYIKKLSLKETMVALEAVLDFLEDKMSPSSQASPTDSQLFDWLFLIMKSHTESLLLSKDKKKLKLLQRLDHCITENIKIYEDYVNIQNMIHVLQKKENILPSKHEDGKYFIETINI